MGQEMILFGAGTIILVLLLAGLGLYTARLSGELSKAKAQSALADQFAQQIASLKDELKSANMAREAAERDHAGLKASFESAERHHTEKLDELEKARKQLTESFQLTANEVLKASGAELNQKSAESLQTLLKPLREQLDGFQKKVVEDAEKRAGQTGALHQLVATLHADTAKLSEDANKLTNALRSSSKVQGDWGELVLTSILERAGLREGQEFHTQQSETLDDGARRRPDIVVDMPNRQRLVIDSKVSLTAFERCVNAEEDGERTLALKQHLASVRAHIKSLDEKDYPSLYEGVSFTLMFVPLEGAASLALQSDPDLASFAWERDIMIATPTTLMMAMRTVQNLWSIDRQNQNAREIAERAGRLYDKLEGFVADLDKVGSRIGQAQDAWHDARKKLTEGAGNAIRQTEMLKQLGAKTKKSLPDEYLDAAGADDDLDLIEGPGTDAQS